MDLDRSQQTSGRGLSFRRAQLPARPVCRMAAVNHIPIIKAGHCRKSAVWFPAREKDRLPRMKRSKRSGRIRW